MNNVFFLVKRREIDDPELPYTHPFHYADPSPWPFLVSVCVFFSAISAVAYFHFYNDALKHLLQSLAVLTWCVIQWLRDVTIEAQYYDLHTNKVRIGLRIGFVLFIISEAMLFFSFFWAFFHSSLSPSFAIGCVWPPFGMEVISYKRVPQLNTVILLVSGATLTWAHANILWIKEEVLDPRYIKYKPDAYVAFKETLRLAMWFLFMQSYEFVNAPFSLSDGIYGSVFFMITGLHGLHVIVGAIFILVQTLRDRLRHFTPWHHFGVVAAAWYWHFVDVVWLLVFIFVYVWGNTTYL